ncbi:5846_t:CDS:2 [Diversispora eburnea]|uniref:5846_t:CDS:1 n=1 Tax=Diversispora eburnea TaxID=1213867 RepID=A0A9N9GBS4_9GLOM|nr:5846_t:CDS:2 [Diversispora eburnea]
MIVYIDTLDDMSRYYVIMIPPPKKSDSETHTPYPKKKQISMIAIPLVRRDPIGEPNDFVLPIILIAIAVFVALVGLCFRLRTSPQEEAKEVIVPANEAFGRADNRVQNAVC